MNAYERAEPAAAEVERAFYAALETADRFAALMESLSADEAAKPEPNPELIRRYGHLRRETAELTAAMEDRALEVVLRIVDRVPMIRTTEEGRFV